MTVIKQTKSSTALVRILALPMMVGVLAGCDYASKLPDAPNNLGGYDQSQKPPSVTGPQQAKRLPPPPADAFAKLKAPVEDRTKAPVQTAMADKPKVNVAPLKAPTNTTAPVDTLPLPKGQATSLEQVAFTPLEFEDNASSAAPVNTTQFGAPSEGFGQQTYSAQNSGATETPAYQPYNAAPLDTYAVEGTAGQPELTAYNSTASQAGSFGQVPVEAYAIAAPPSVQTEIYSAPAPVSASPLAVLRTRLPNGAVVNVHPVIGAPGTVSATLARTVTLNIGSPVDEAAAANASVVFDLRGRAERNTDGYVSAEWKLFDANRNVVGIFPERQTGTSWQDMNDSALQAMGRRVADRIARNGELRKATLYAAANPISTTVPNATYVAAQPLGTTTLVLKNGGTLAAAPMPRVSPRAATTYSQPTRTATTMAPIRTQQAAAQPAPRRPVQPIAPRPTVVAKAPTALVAPAPVRAVPKPPQVVTQAPRPVAPPPTFDTLRPTNNTQPVAAPTVVASGPRPLVFRGVQGAPGDGDQALSREVGKLLAQSGARMSATPQPGALFLSAQVSKTPGANADRIEIIWRVQDSSGENIGQVTQANDVPRGMLDNAWGEDATYAAEGARDGIMELLQGVGALES